MNRPPIPTAYEISRIAAILRTQNIAITPIAAVREAMRIWYLATCEITQAAERSFPDNLDRYTSALDADEYETVSKHSSGFVLYPQPEPGPDEKRFWLISHKESSIAGARSREYSEVLEYINANTNALKCERFKNLEELKNAWYKFSPQDRDHNRTVAVYEIKNFLLTQVRPWKKAVKEITGKADESKATGAFRSFYFDLIRDTDVKFPVHMDDETMRERVAAFIESRKREGMSGEEIGRMRHAYKSTPRRAPRVRKK